MLNNNRLQINLFLSELDMFIYSIELTPVCNIKVGEIPLTVILIILTKYASEIRVSLSMHMNELIEIFIPFASDKSDQVLRVDKEDYLASGLCSASFFDKEQIVSQTNLFPSLGYLKLTERRLF
jgi:hypothetical protein